MKQELKKIKISEEFLSEVGHKCNMCKYLYTFPHSLNMMILI